MSDRSFTILVLGGAALAGGAIGVASVGTTPDGREQLAEVATTAAVSAGMAGSGHGRHGRRSARL